MLAAHGTARGLRAQQLGALGEVGGACRVLVGGAAHGPARGLRAQQLGGLGEVCVCVLVGGAAHHIARGLRALTAGSIGGGGCGGWSCMHVACSKTGTGVSGWGYM